MKNKKTKKLLAYKKGGGIVYSTLGLGNSQNERGVESHLTSAQTFELQQQNVEQRETIRKLSEKLKTVEEYAETERRRRELEEKRREAAVRKEEQLRMVFNAEKAGHAVVLEDAQRLRRRLETTHEQLLRTQQAREMAERAAWGVAAPREIILSQTKPLIIKDYDTVNDPDNVREDIPPDILRELQDPLTLDIMTDPVITTSGRTFDRKSINDYIARLRDDGRVIADPFTQIEIYPNILIPNMAIRSLIQHYFPTAGGRKKLTKKKKSKRF